MWPASKTSTKERFSTALTLPALAPSTCQVSALAVAHLALPSHGRASTQRLLPSTLHMISLLPAYTMTRIPDSRSSGMTTSKLWPVAGEGEEGRRRGRGVEDAISSNERARAANGAGHTPICHHIRVHARTAGFPAPISHAQRLPDRGLVQVLLHQREIVAERPNALFAVV